MKTRLLAVLLCIFFTGLVGCGGRSDATDEFFKEEGVQTRDGLIECDIKLVNDENGTLSVTAYGQNPQSTGEFLVQFDFESTNCELDVFNIWCDGKEVRTFAFGPSDGNLDSHKIQLGINAEEVSCLSFDVKLWDTESNEQLLYPGTYLYPNAKQLEHPKQQLSKDEMSTFSVENQGFITTVEGVRTFVMDLNVENCAPIKYAYKAEITYVNDREVEYPDQNTLVLNSNQNGLLHADITQNDLEALSIGSISKVDFSIFRQPMGDGNTPVIGDNMQFVGTFSLYVTDSNGNSEADTDSSQYDIVAVDNDCVTVVFKNGHFDSDGYFILDYLVENKTEEELYFCVTHESYGADDSHAWGGAGTQSVAAGKTVLDTCTFSSSPFSNDSQLSDASELIFDVIVCKAEDVPSGDLSAYSSAQAQKAVGYQQGVSIPLQ